ncbi:MAG: hypothetical protein Q8P92_01995 [Candidatus Daviesbacteria bacterium]|nr:hypothetical protein [Candidatus Daviesbacteria bacterium]
MILLFTTLLILLINVVIFMPFFNLGLFGDDWLTIFRYFYYTETPKHLGPYSADYFNRFTYFFNSYGPQDTIMASLYKIFGQDSNIYFLTSYILRVIASFSLYLPAFYITKKKVAALFACFFFLFSSIGLETSAWVFNMPSYLAIIFFNLLLLFYFRFRQEKKIKYLFLSYLFFFLTFTSNPIRAHGLLPFMIFLEIFWVISERGRKVVKSSLMRLGGFFLIFLMIYFLGLKESISGNPVIGINNGLNNTLSFFSQGRFDFLFYPVATIGSMLIPDSFLRHGGEITSLSQYLSKIFVPIFFIFSILAIILYKSIKNLSGKFFPTLLSLSVFWAIFVSVISKFNLTTFSNVNYISLLLIGGDFLIIIFSLIIFLKEDISVRGGLLIALAWTIISFLYPWWVSPGSIFLTSHRYLIISGVGISLLLAMIIGLGKNSKSILTLLVIGSIFLLIHSNTVRNYLNQQYKTHSRETVRKIWSSMPYIPEVGRSTEPLIFYFEGDGTNAAIVGDSITFGFPPHMGIIYKITEENLMPIPMSEWKDVTSAVIDGKSLAPHNRPQKPIPVEQIYSFRLEGKDNLIDTTESTRRKLIDLK